MMYIQIDNAGTINKGAELMLYSIYDYFKYNSTHNATLVFGSGYANMIDVRKIGYFQIAKNLRRFKLNFDKIIRSKNLLPLGLVKKNTIPRSVIKEITTIISPNTENWSKNINAFMINAVSIKPNTARKIVVRIRPVVQTQ